MREIWSTPFSLQIRSKSTSTGGCAKRPVKTLRIEFNTRQVFRTLKTAQEALDEWVTYYNSQRPHWRGPQTTRQRHRAEAKVNRECPASTGTRPSSINRDSTPAPKSHSDLARRGRRHRGCMPRIARPQDTPGGLGRREEGKGGDSGWVPNSVSSGFSDRCCAADPRVDWDSHSSANARSISNRILASAQGRPVRR
jgi:hypothetical protein